MVPARPFLIAGRILRGLASLLHTAVLVGGPARVAWPSLSARR
jgi:hypothetical protein